MQEIDFTYYEKRIYESEDLLVQSKSQTLTELITKAKLLTDKSLEILVKIQNSTKIYLTAHNI